MLLTPLARGAAMNGRPKLAYLACIVVGAVIGTKTDLIVELAEQRP